MHATYQKISARERDLAPRFYYKRTRSYTCCERIKHFFRKLLAFLFTQVGVCGLVAAYMVIGAFIFAGLEAESQMKEAEIAAEMRAKFAAQLWNVTLHTNVLFGAEWRIAAEQMVATFQAETVENVHHGYTGTEPGVPVWTFSAALMYSLTIFTTIGYGNLTPKTDVGKIMTIVYALIGIPLMLLYMSNIGNILGSSFKYTYTKLCRCHQPTKNLPSKATLPSVLAPPSPVQSDERKGSSKSKASSTEAGSRGSWKLSLYNSRKSKSSSDDKGSKASNPSSPTKPRPPPNVTVSADQTPQSQPQPSPVDDDIEHEFPDVVEDPNKAGRRMGIPTANLTVPDRRDGPAKSRLTSKASFRGLRSAFTPVLNRKHPQEPHTQQNNGSSSDPTPSSAELPSPSTPSSPKTHTVEFKLVEDLRLVTIPVSSCLFVLLFYIMLGTITFSAWEGWNYLDGVYFCFTSLMTIGFGDFVPGNDYIYKVHEETVSESEARAKLVIGTIYILLGMALMAMCFNLMQEKLVQQVRTAARRVGLLRPARYDEDEDAANATQTEEY